MGISDGYSCAPNMSEVLLESCGKNWVVMTSRKDGGEPAACNHQQNIRGADLPKSNLCRKAVSLGRGVGQSISYGGKQDADTKEWQD